MWHLPSAVIPQAHALAQMVAKAMNCLERPTSDGLPDFCGRCTNCVRIAEADALEDRPHRYVGGIGWGLDSLCRCVLE